MGFHGSPRYTGDLDIWIEISDSNALKMISVINDFGFNSLGLRKEDFLKKGYITQIGYPPLRIDILNEIDGIRFDEASKNMRTIVNNGIVVKFIGFSDLIANKKASGRAKDFIDIKSLEKADSKKKGS